MRASSLLIVIAVCASGSEALAHGMRSGALRIEQTGEGRALVEWRQTVPARVELELPSGCKSSAVGEANDRVYALDCSAPLESSTFGVRGLGPIITDATVLVSFLDGRSASHLLSAEHPSWELPRRQSALDVMTSYVQAGVLHILSGPDHLLFLLMLVMLLGRVGAVMLAESAFTLSHTLSFSATALGLIRVSSPAAEACIALSLLLLALDVERAHRGGTVSIGGAAMMALVFGLVHGLGFAGGLRELGLPPDHVSFALLGFGLGVEAGQVAFLLAALALFSQVRGDKRLIRGATFAGGVLASFWLVSRLSLCLDL
jgi:hydrogenase/urease accessory protein HupE